MIRRATLLVLFACAAASPAFAQPFGIDSRTTNTTLLIDAPPVDPLSPMMVVRVFPALDFAYPVLLVESPDASGRLFVVEREGRLRTFPNVPAPTPAQVSTFLDLTPFILTSGEQGLLSVAFDPDYATNGEFYVYYSYDNGMNPGATRISRFTNDDPADDFTDVATEEVVLEVQQPYTNHNGGMIAFGPDDMLYIGLGDGGAGDDPLNSGQDTTTLLGSMLRIDVRGAPDAGLNYAIPPDNPFVGDPPNRPEIWAWGLRNPWRWSFDAINGHLFCGDVGQNVTEEVSVIRRGENHGWKIYEGFDCRPGQSPCDPTGLTPPILDYDHTIGRAVGGGFVYYGDQVPELYGVYLYSDIVNRWVAGLTYNGQYATNQMTLVSGAGILFNTAGFGQDSSGEVYLLDFSAAGGIYVLRPTSPAPPSDFPTKLSDIPALLAAGLSIDQTDDGIVPYEPSAKLWSDGTLKTRYIAMPGLERATWRASGGWDFPDKTVIVKNFSLPLDEADPLGSARRIETRLLYLTGGAWRGYSYEWNEAETDAVLLTSSKNRAFTILDDGGTPFSYTWTYPSREDCGSCHNAASNFVLGTNTPQMNWEWEFPASGTTDNQLRTYDHIGFFDAPLPAPPSLLPAMPDPADATASIRDRARAYLHANCAVCHRPGGPTPADMDLRWETADQDTTTIGEPPLLGDLGISGAELVYPGDPARSILLQRMNRRGAAQMPPLASSRIDPGGVQIVTEWILSLAGNRARDWAEYE